MSRRTSSVSSPARRRGPPFASSLISTSRRSSAISFGLAGCCRAISALRSAAGAPSPTSYGRASPTLSFSRLPRCSSTSRWPCCRPWPRRSIAIVRSTMRFRRRRLCSPPFRTSSSRCFFSCFLSSCCRCCRRSRSSRHRPISSDGCEHWCCRRPRWRSSWPSMRRGCCGTI